MTECVDMEIHFHFCFDFNSGLFAFFLSCIIALATFAFPLMTSFFYRPFFVFVFPFSFTLMVVLIVVDGKMVVLLGSVVQNIWDLDFIGNF
jgi:hypothetical protein